MSVNPTATNNDGTRLQVVVPDLAQSGNVTVVGGTGSVMLQVVPVITRISGRPGIDAIFNLFGSGFMEGASTIRVGGVEFVDQYTNVTGDVTGNRNSQYDLVAQLTVEGPITVTTAGGSFTFAGPTYGQPPFVEFSGIMATGAITGQNITLRGRGFTTNTFVEFEAVDDKGTAGRLIRTNGTVNSDGTQLTVTVPAFAQTGMVRVVGTDATFPLQILPTLRAMGGAVTAGNRILLEGTGLVEGELTVNIDGQLVGDEDVSVIVGLDPGLDQQIVELTVPAGVRAGVITVTTNGGSATLRPTVTVMTQPDLAWTRYRRHVGHGCGDQRALE